MRRRYVTSVLGESASGGPRSLSDINKQGRKTMLGRFSTSVAIAVAGVALASAPAAAAAYEDLLAAAQAEMASMSGKLAIALDWPDSDAAGVMTAFKEEFPFVKDISYVRETGVGPFGQYLISLQQGETPPYDIMHIASEFEQQYKATGAFIEPLFDYRELNTSLPAAWPRIDEASFDPEGYFLSTTAVTRGNAYNPNMVAEGEKPDTWAACTDSKWRGNVITDARNKLQAYQYDPRERDRHMAWLADLVANDVVLTRGQSNVLQKVAGGEFAIACGVNYHTANRMIERDGITTLKFTMAETVPLELGTRLFVPKWSATPATSQLFTVWAATAGQGALGATYRGFPSNPRSHKHQASKGKYISVCGGECALQFEDFNAEFQAAMGIPVAN